MRYGSICLSAFDPLRKTKALTNKYHIRLNIYYSLQYLLKSWTELRDDSLFDSCIELISVTLFLSDNSLLAKILCEKRLVVCNYQSVNTQKPWIRIITIYFQIYL